MTFLLVVIYLLLGVLILFQLYLWKELYRDYGVFIPSPPTLPIIGSGHLLVGTAADFLIFVDKAWKKYGRRCRVHVLHKVFFMFSDPKDVEVILTSNDILDKASDYVFLQPWLGEGLLTSTGDKWRRHRKFLTPAFHFSILRHFVPIFDRKSDVFVEKLRAKADGSAFDAYPFIAKCTLDQLMETAMGMAFDSEDKRDTEYMTAVKIMTNIVNDRMKSTFIRYDWCFMLTPEYKVYKKTLKYLHDFTDKMIRDRREMLKSKNVDLASLTRDDDEVLGAKKNIAFLDLLLLSEIDGKKLSDTSIREEVDTFLFEGHDTTASTIGFTVYVLGDYPEIQQQLFEEQWRIFGDNNDRPTTFRDIQEMKYLDMAIRETLRIYPAIPFVGRHLNVKTKINDMILPANTNFGINVFSMGRDPELFEDPMVYRPERFLPEECSKRNPFSVVNFSAGLRNCIGQKFAMYEMKMTLSKLIRNYKVLSANAEPLQLAGDVVLKSLNGIPIRLEMRT